MSSPPVAQREGVVPLHLNLDEPDHLDVVRGVHRCAAAAPSFRGEVWRQRILVPATTIDALIRAHGVPRFVKIDVEGYEAAGR